MGLSWVRPAAANKTAATTTQAENERATRDLHNDATGKRDDRQNPNAHEERKSPARRRVGPRVGGTLPRSSSRSPTPPRPWSLGVPCRVLSALHDDDADRLGQRGFVVLDGWLGAEHALLLRAEHEALLARGCFASSRVGQGAARRAAPGIRSDTICWFDVDADEDAGDGRTGVRPGPAATRLLARLEALRARLNESCFLSLTRVECHAACYEPGTSYEAHVDAFDADTRRVISFSHYLNDHWQPADGGCLRMHGDAGAGDTDIEPRFDRLVIFQSRTMRHGVLPVTRRRLSSTGWMSAT